MNLIQLFDVFETYGVSKIYAKRLSPNDNSKNQVYLGGSFDVLNIFPIGTIVSESPGEWDRERFKASVDFSWITEYGDLASAPFAQLILYPKYPEVRFSGFLRSCSNSPSSIMTTRDEGRILFLGSNDERKIIGYVGNANSTVVSEYNNLHPIDPTLGVFEEISLLEAADTKAQLINELKRIHELGWIKAKRLDKNGNILSCNSPNCGGYTLESELGITPNGYSEPDYLGWELKQFGVKKFHLINSVAITLMTPEPTGGHYKDQGVESFIRKFGYPDKNGVTDRLNFGGVHKVDTVHKLTNLELKIEGFDLSAGKITNANGKICLRSSSGEDTAHWSFASMLAHWNRKHYQACYIPSLCDKTASQKYSFGNNVLIGEGTEFTLFLKQLAVGNVYYDPGIKLEKASTEKKIKRRSQFRVSSGNITKLYKKNEVVDVLNGNHLVL